ncbi:hypothetical protein POTG_02993 [Paenibacillus sp. oral taxon 786 str. D14]|uniref:hypothetical protein n=1 Tax=Paenibacillus TaxID=44249 RepID=UPI0001AFD485|nr:MULTISPECIES: hypothetical protein [Paenibacillus]EES72385.1 hypothetical protein POTG_02993 [Paenibacillus sp. oral taxon 786 str. D14]
MNQRDWNKDMERAKTEPIDAALIYWLEFAREEQEKRAEVEMINYDLRQEYQLEKERADKLEEREEQLIHYINHSIRIIDNIKFHLNLLHSTIPPARKVD